MRTMRHLKWDSWYVMMLGILRIVRFVIDATLDMVRVFSSMLNVFMRFLDILPSAISVLWDFIPQN